MKTDLNLFGKQFTMAAQASRRRLVVLFYGAFSAIILLSWLADATGQSAGFWVIEFTIFASPLFGGYLNGWLKPYNVGLVKPFGGNAVNQYAARLPQRSLMRRIYPKAEELRAIRNDERELNQRDRAHFLAWRGLSGIVMLAFLLEFGQGGKIPVLALVGISAHASQSAIFVLLEVGYNLAFTLPAAILLWTEPDLEPEPEVSAA